MKPGVPWSVKGIESEAREAAKDAARRAGLTLGQWLNQKILDQDREQATTAGSGLPPESAPAETGELISRIDTLKKRLDILSDDRTIAAAPERARARPLARWRETPPQPAPANASIHDDILGRLDRTDATMHDGGPAGKAGIEARERALFDVVDHIELTDKRNAEVLKTIQTILPAASRIHPAPIRTPPATRRYGNLRPGSAN